jgi:NADH-quinone oxidoreductase subunit A
MIETYLPLALMLVIAFVFGAIMANLSRWVGPKKPTAEKLSVYESGMAPIGSTRERISVKYYVVAMLFIVFDIELIFLYPWAVTFDKIGAFAIGQMFLFMILLFIAYVYIWKKGALEWD